MILPVFGVRRIFMEYQQLSRSRFVRPDYRADWDWHDHWVHLTFYLGDGWNILQLTSGMSTTLSCCLFLSGSTHVRTMAAIAAFAIWLEMLFYLRAFEFAGGLIRIIFKVRRTAHVVALLIGVAHVCSSSSRVVYHERGTPR